MELFAYLDPGSASALLAAVLAGIAGAGAAIRTYGAKIKERLFFWKKDEPAAATPAASAAAPSDSSDDKPAEK